jgi:hypothetical protein
VDAQLDPIVATILSTIGVFFEHRWAAPLVLAPLMLMFALSLLVRAWLRARPYYAGLRRRVDVLRDVLKEGGTTDEKRVSFAANFDRIVTVMQDPKGAEGLVRAWHEFEESIVDQSQRPVIRNTIRPGTYFMRAAPRPTGLAFWANSFIGIGLLFTFLGIVVALNTTAIGLRGGEATVVETQMALYTLLSITSVKFFTSIAGVFCSVLLRFGESHMTHRLDTRISQICDLLERGLLYVPPQLLAAQQLDELKRQSTQIERFNTDLAIQIGDRVGHQFQTALTPLATSLEQLNSRMTGMSDRLGEGVGKAIEGAASGELRALGQTLNSLGEKLQMLSGSVEGSGEEAARQIRAAGADFSAAARGIGDAFEKLISNVDGLGSRIAADSEMAGLRQRDAIDSAIASFKRGNDESVRALQASLAALEGAGASAASRLHASIGTAVASAAGEAETTIRIAIEKAGIGFASAGDGLKEAVATATAQISLMTQAMRAAETGTASNARNLVDTANGISTVARILNEAAQGFASAATPVSEASRSFREAANRIDAAAQRSEAAAAQSHQQMSKLADGMREVHEAASDAWHDYRKRFEGVDEALAKTVKEMINALESVLEDFRTFSTDFDAKMAQAVGRLAPIVDTISESSEDIAEFGRQLKATVKVAAE